MRRSAAGAAPRVLTFGEALVGYATTDVGLRGAARFTRFAGGADLNVAVGLRRLGIAATWASVLARDAHGDYLQDVVRAFGVDAVTVRADGSTALMFKATGAPGDPEVLQVRHATAFAHHADLLMPHVLEMTGIDHVHLTGIALAISPVTRAVTLALQEAAIAAGITVSFDPNLRLNLWPDRGEMRRVVNAVAARADIMLPGRGEARLLTGHDDPRAIADFYLAAGAQEVAVKLGAGGAVAYNSDVSVQSRPFAVQSVDTVGAGDGFAAGYIAAALTGASLRERVDQAAAVGALVTTRPGDLAAMPSSLELDNLLSAGRVVHAVGSHQGGPASRTGGVVDADRD